MILFLCEQDDESARLVAEALTRRGQRVVTFDHGRYPAEAAISVRTSRTDGWRAELRGPAGSFFLSDVRAAYVRSLGMPRASTAVTDPLVRSYLVAEAREHLYDLWAALRSHGCFWLPGAPNDLGPAQRKVDQLARAQRLGLSVPDTLMSNDPEAVLEFHRAHEGRAVSKLVGSALPTVGRGRVLRYTERLRSRDLHDLDGVRVGPTIYQALVPKAYEVRATVVGGRVLAAAIDSQATNRTRVDWRRYDLGHTPHRAIQLPASIESRLVALCRSFGLSYGAIDLIVTPEGEHVFLELNPAGQWQWIEQMTGLPISDAIADELEAGATRVATGAVA